MARACHVELLHFDDRLEGVEDPPGGGKPAQLHHLLLAAGVVGGEEAQGQGSPLLPVSNVVQAPAAAP